MALRHNVEFAQSRWPVLELPATHSWITIDPLTATTQGQHIWYDQPDGPHHWPLPLNHTG